MAAQVIHYRFRLRRAAAARWTSTNDLLYQGEIGVETDTNFMKLGDGTTHWNNLPYWNGAPISGFNNIADGQVLAWDATNSQWTPANAGKQYQPGNGISITNPSTTTPTINNTLASIALSGRVSAYSNLPTGLTTSDAGTAYLNDGDGLVYVWDGSAWPASSNGLAVQGVSANKANSGPSSGTLVIPTRASDFLATFIGGQKYLIPAFKPALGNYAGIVLSDSPIAYWQLDETTGTTAVDQQGVQNGAYTGGYTLGNQNLVQGQSPDVLLDGSSGYVDVATNSAFNVTAAWSLECWFKLSGTPNSGCGLISEQFIGSGDQVLFEMGFGLNTGGTTLQVGFYNNGWNLTPGVTVSTGAVHHAVGVWDGTNLITYLDGAQVDTATVSSSSSGTANNVLLGRRHFTKQSPYFNGALGHCAIYDKALSASRVAAHYNAG